MILLPNHQHAFIAIEKLRDYCLNSFHPVGKEKAIVFKAALGLTNQDAKLLKEAVLEEISRSGVIMEREDEYGKRYTVDIKIRNLDKEAIVRTGWIIKTSEHFPRLITCYVK